MAAAGRGSGRVRSTWPGQVVKKLPEVGVGDRRIETTQQLGRGLPSLHHRQAMLDQIPTIGVNIMLEFPLLFKSSEFASNNGESSRNIPSDLFVDHRVLAVGLVLSHELTHVAGHCHQLTCTMYTIKNQQRSSFEEERGDLPEARLLTSSRYLSTTALVSMSTLIEATYCFTNGIRPGKVSSPFMI